MTLGETVPEAVAANVAFLERNGLWFVVSRNPPVHSCREAADQRVRLGDRGIPLSDELKSSVGCVDAGGGRRYVVVHCRGHQLIDDRRLSAALGGPFRRLELQELEVEFNMGYGSVTPFGFALRSDVTQVFDRTVTQRFFPPYTMMTNLGDLTYGVEFEPIPLIAALPTAMVADIVDDASARVPTDHTLGILTGNAPESGMLLWARINERIRAHNNRQFRGDVAFPRVIVESVPGMGMSMELPLRETEVRPVVLEGVQRLCHNGATIVGVACNTSQYFAPDVAEVCSQHGARFISMADETADYLHRQGVSRFDFFGISAVMDFDGWSGYGRLRDEFDLVAPNELKVASINDVGFRVKQQGVEGGSVNRLRDLVNGASVTDTIVIALTELSAVLDTQKRRGAKRYIDTLEVLAERMADLYLAERALITSRGNDDAEQIRRQLPFEE